MNNFEDLVYTYKHRKVVKFLGELYFGDDELMEQLNRHDMDKMYLLLFYDKERFNMFHNLLASHHDNDIPKTDLDYIEMVLDWESARYTKEDKPLNAYDTLLKYYPHLEDKILPILEEMGIAYSTFDRDERVTQYVESLGEPTIEDIKNELVDYIENSIGMRTKENDEPSNSR